MPSHIFTFRNLKGGFASFASMVWQLAANQVPIRRRPIHKWSVNRFSLPVPEVVWTQEGHISIQDRWREVDIGVGDGILYYMRDHVGVGIVQKMCSGRDGIILQVLALSPATDYGIDDPRFNNPHQLVVDPPLGGIHDVNHRLVLSVVTILHHEKYFSCFPPESTAESLQPGQPNTRDLVSPGPDVFYITYVDTGKRREDGGAVLSEISRCLLPTVKSSLYLSVFEIRHMIRLSIARLHNPYHGAPRSVRKVIHPDNNSVQLLPGGLVWTTIRNVTGMVIVACAKQYYSC